MCLAIPGRILRIATVPPVGSATGARDPDDPLWRMAEVDFGGVRQQVSLACLPEAAVGDRVLVHVGLALSVVDDELP
jgi:hydrogenase expression/formation protein HypC